MQTTSLLLRRMRVRLMNILLDESASRSVNLLKFYGLCFLVFAGLAILSLLVRAGLWMFMDIPITAKDIEIHVIFAFAMPAFLVGVALGIPLLYGGIERLIIIIKGGSDSGK